MLARPHARDATLPPDESAADLEAQLAAIQAKLAQAKAKEQREADERAHFEGSKVLVHGSPSPRELRKGAGEGERSPRLGGQASNGSVRLRPAGCTTSRQAPNAY